MTSIYDRLRIAKAGLRLSEKEYFEGEITQLLAKLDADKVDLDELIQRVEKKIESGETAKKRIMAYTIGAFLLLFASIKGVDFEISLLGIKLSHIELLKEVIFFLSPAVLLNVTGIEYQNRDLMEIRRQIYKERYGEGSGEILERTFESGAKSSVISLGIWGQKFEPIGRNIVDNVRSLNIFILLSVALVAAFYIYATVLVDIWSNPNISKAWARALTSVIVIVSIIDWLASVLVSTKRFTYIDRSAWDNFQFYADGDSGELSPEAISFIQQEFERKNKGPISRILRWLR